MKYIIKKCKRGDKRMPIGIIINTLSIAAGGVLGVLVGPKLREDFKANLTMIFGCCAMAMGISSIILMANMPAVILAVVLGTMIGMWIHLGEKINKMCAGMQRIMSRFMKNQNTNMSEEEFMMELITVIVLFCASGTGIYGSIVSGMSGDHSILISKSILDLFTAMIFAATLGAVVSAIAVPQFVIFLILFLCGGLILPLTTPAMINDFKACGGILLLATGFRMIKIKMFPTADMIPAMILVMPISALWTNYIVPFVS